MATIEITAGPSREQLVHALLFSSRMAEFRPTFSTLDFSFAGLCSRTGGYVGVTGAKLVVSVSGLRLEDASGERFLIDTYLDDGTKMEFYYDTITRKGHVMEKTS